MEFTDEALVILGIAQSKAAVSQSTAGSEHILIALSESKDLVGVALREKGVEAETVQEKISAFVKIAESDDSIKKASFTAIIARSKEIARDQGVSKVGTQQLLLALLDIECDGKRIVQELEVDSETLTKEVSKGIKSGSSKIKVPSVKFSRRHFMMASGSLALLFLIFSVFSFSMIPKNRFEPMADPLKELVSICPPPKKPTYFKSLEVDSESNSIDWSKVEKELNLNLPDDFKKLYETYGSGVFSNSLWLFRLDKASVLDIHDAIRGFKKLLPERYGEYQIYPKMPGLFQFGTVSGDCTDMFWLTSGKPDNWPILINYIKSDHPPERFEMKLTEFIVRSFKGQIKSKELPKNYEKTEIPMFSPDFYDDDLKLIKNKWILSGHRLGQILLYRFPGTYPQTNAKDYKAHIDMLKSAIFELRELAAQHQGKYQELFELVKKELGKEAYQSLMNK